MSPSTRNGARSARRPLARGLNSHHDGGRAIVQLLKSLEDDEALSASVAPELEFRGGRPQRNLVQECVDRALASGSREALEGMCLALTSVVALCASGFGGTSANVARWVDASHAERGFAAFLATVAAEPFDSPPGDHPRNA